MYRISKLLLKGLVTFSILFVAYAAVAGDDRERDSELLMGVAPFMSPEALFKRLSPLRDYLRDETKRDVVLELSRNVNKLIERTDSQHYDILLTGPTFVLRAFDSGLYLPGVIPDLTTAVLIVGLSSPIQSIEQLKGKKIAVPPSKGAVAKMASSFFRSKGIGDNDLPQSINYAGHNAAFMAVINGDVDAAFIEEYGYHDALSNGDSAKEIGRTKPFPGIGMIISSRLSTEVREKIINAMLRLSESPQGAVVLKKISSPPFRRYSIQEYEDVRNYFTNISSGKK